MPSVTRFAAALGFLGVAVGAFAAHAPFLQKLLAANNTAAIWQTAVFYQMIHAVASLWAADRHPKVAWLWTVGVVLFSGSLYLLAVTNIKWFGPITPIGGLLFLAGWVMLILKPQRN